MAYEYKPRPEIGPVCSKEHERKQREAIFGPDPVVKPAEPERIGSPFNAYSLRGMAAEFEARATDAKPLLGSVCMSGQATILYAQPNAGKTLVTLHLLIEAVKAGRIDADRAYYLNADDSSRGFAEKLNIADQLGIHTLAPSFRAFKAPELLGLLRRAAAEDRARCSTIVIDTLKKFTSLMKKDEAAEFGNACRQFVMQGGTVVALAHTAKNANADGSVRYAGTTDFVEDFDAVYVLKPLDASPGSVERVVEFRNIKRRGDNPEVAAYAYSTERGISYEELLLSVRSVEPGQLEEFQRIAEQVNDDVVIQAIRERILAADFNGKMELATMAGDKAGVSGKAAMRIVDKYTGEDPSQHHWHSRRGARGVLIYELHPAA
jgi:hypothetical protein